MDISGGLSLLMGVGIVAAVLLGACFLGVMLFRARGQSAPNETSADERSLTWVTQILAVFAIACCVIVFGYAIMVTAVGFPYWAEVLRDHFGAIIGLPGAAVVAFTLVVFLRQTAGPIEFEGFGFKFKGAAGQVLMWVTCFLAIAIAIKICW